jgi:Flp pilus assembly protein TadD
LSFALSHAIACALFAYAAYLLLPPHYRIPRWPPLALFFSLTCFVPFVSVLGIGATVLLSRRLKPRVRMAEFGMVEPPSYRSGDAQSPRAYAAGGIKALLFNASAQLDMRMKALLTTQAMPRRLANPLLVQALSGDTDDIRLVAYGILSAQERELSERISRLQNKFIDDGDTTALLARDRELAQAHWELVHNQLVQGDLRHYTLETAEQLTLSCIERAPNDAALWMLLGKIRHERGETASAETAFRRAEALGFSSASILPYLAEHAWRRGEFAAVRELMSRLPETGTSPLVAALRRYWTADLSISSNRAED